MKCLQTPLLICATLVLVCATFLIPTIQAAPAPSDANAVATQYGPKILLPLGGRTAYQTNERIEVSVVRTGGEALKANDLTLALTGQDGSKLDFTIPVPAVAMAGADARTTEHLYLNASMIRPGNYSLDVTVDDATVSQNLQIRSHIRGSSFKTYGWANTANSWEQLALGEDSLGFDMMYGWHTGNSSVLAGYDWMRCCTQGGAHQMDMRMACDWSDPYVIRGAAGWATSEALSDRVYGNCIGVHLYDEPGLTWWKNPESNAMTPNAIPAQMRSYKSAFGRDLVNYLHFDRSKPEQVQEWMDWGDWKESFMPANWKLDRFAVESVQPNMITCTQSQYGWCSYGDGYYFNIAQTLPVTSGHGGYEDFGPAYFNPSFFLEMARARDMVNPCWYLPCWYSSTVADNFRLEQYLSFQTNLQGMSTPPDMKVQEPSRIMASPTIVETNKDFLRMGTIFSTMPATRTTVAILYSMSDNLHRQVVGGTSDSNYYSLKTFGNLEIMYLAGKLIHVPMQTVVDEDVMDGTLAMFYKAVVLGGIDYVEPKVVTALEAFAANGGLVILTSDCTVKIKGAVQVAATSKDMNADKIKAAWDAKDAETSKRLGYLDNKQKTALPLGAAILAELKKVGVGPIFQCDNPGVCLTRQGQGDIEYNFAVNAAYDFEVVGWVSPAPAVAKIALPADGRPIYDAMAGGEFPEIKKEGESLAGTFRFGPGQMRVFARTARPIGSVQVMTPVVYRDTILSEMPLRLEIGACLLDDQNKILCGSAPLEIKVIDPLGTVRFDLFRATNNGSFQEKLPLAANDAAGAWKVVVHDLLANKEASATFQYAPAKQCGVVAGAARRAVFIPQDSDNIFRFCRNNRSVTIVTGSADYHKAAADRITEILMPWGITCTTVAAADVKPRALTEDQAPTWCSPFSHLYGSSHWVAGEQKAPEAAGFDIPGAAIVLGDPNDNAIINFLALHRYLSYKPVRGEFPGRGRGLVAWQRDGIAVEQESIALIADDAAGLAEAVGTMYEMMAGIAPLTPWELPASNSIAVATKALVPTPALAKAWEIPTPDRVFKTLVVKGGKFISLSMDGTLTIAGADGKSAAQSTFAGNEFWHLDASTDGGLIAVGTMRKVFLLNASGKTTREIDYSKRAIMPGVTALAVKADGSQIAVAGEDGSLAVYGADGKQAWEIPGLVQADMDKYAADMKAYEADTANREAAKKPNDEMRKKYTEDKKAYDDAKKKYDIDKKAYDLKTGSDKKAYDAQVKKYKDDLAAYDKAPEGKKPPKPIEPAAPAELAKIVEPTPLAEPQYIKTLPLPKKPLPDRISAIVFSGDGKILVAAKSPNVAQVVDLASGKAVGAISGFGSDAGYGQSYGGVLLPLGNDVVLVNKDRIAKVTSADPNNAKPVTIPGLTLDSKTNSASVTSNDPNAAKPVSIPGLALDPKDPKVRIPSVIVAMAPCGDGFVIGNESTRAVAQLKSLEGKSEELLGWQAVTPNRIVKKISVGPAGIAVGYWGGTVRVLDLDGKVKTENVFVQDVSTVDWVGDKLVVGTADGKLTGLSAK